LVLARACFFAVGVFAVGGGAGCLPQADDIQTQVYEVCYSGVPAQIAPSGSGQATGLLLVPDVDDQVDLDDAHVGLRNLAVTPADGVDDFHFVDAAHVDVAGQRILELPGPGLELYGEASAPPNLMPHALGGGLRLTLVFEGAVPTTNWGVEVDACFSVDGVSVDR